ncbi:MAG: hypothetical protein EAZ16_08145 [Sphingobacteriales bacterium]|nr:MAG: hypothetical protein EAZ16_08145 [Sphingobacteriales bacterium]
MKKYSVLLSLVVLCATGCVQKAYKKTVVFKLNTTNQKNIQSVGVRGSEKPLSWQQDLQMNAIKKDTFYTATINFLTGYNFTEVKFAINGNFELKEKDNRKIVFSKSDTTYYDAVFDVEK